MTSQVRRRRGATFVEITMAVLFLALAIVPLMDSILSGSRRARQDRMRVFATALCASAMERYRLETADNASAAVGTASSDETLNPSDAPGDWAEWRAKFEVEPTYSDNGDGTGVLQVDVRWDESGQTRTITMKTVLALTFDAGAP